MLEITEVKLPARRSSSQKKDEKKKDDADTGAASE
jgi:hypothetical protein